MTTEVLRGASRWIFLLEASRSFSNRSGPRIPKENLRFLEAKFEEKIKQFNEYSKTLNNRTRGANNEYRGGPGGPGTGFCSPGGGFIGNRRSGKPLRLLRLRNRARDHKNEYQDHRTIPVLVIRAPCTIVEGLRVRKTYNSRKKQPDSFALCWSWWWFWWSW